MKIRPVGAVLLHADGETDRQTDVTKQIVTFTVLPQILKTVDLFVRVHHVT